MCFGSGGGGDSSRGASTTEGVKSTGDGKFHPHSSAGNGNQNYSGPQYPSGLLAPTTEATQPKSILGAR
jgi:hypothetical protein